MIERIARTCAIWADHHDPDAWRAYQGVARLILAEMRTPTDAMFGAALPTFGPNSGPHRIWRTMIDAALAEPDQIAPE